MRSIETSRMLKKPTNTYSAKIMTKINSILCIEIQIWKFYECGISNFQKICHHLSYKRQYKSKYIFDSEKSEKQANSKFSKANACKRTVYYSISLKFKIQPV